MLCARSTRIRVECTNVVADEASGRADWQAWYPFSGSGREVHNVIHAEFRFRDGRIVAHVDEFDLWRWSRRRSACRACCSAGRRCCAAVVRANAAAQLARFRARVECRSGVVRTRIARVTGLRGAACEAGRVAARCAARPSMRTSTSEGQQRQCRQMIAATNTAAVAIDRSALTNARKNSSTPTIATRNPEIVDSVNEAFM